MSQHDIIQSKSRQPSGSFIFYYIVNHHHLLYNIPKGVDYMKGTGIVRKIDPVGRITLPVELRKQFHLEKGDEIELFVDGDMVVLKKKEKSK